jgi:periplasmic protein TonB
MPVASRFSRSVPVSIGVHLLVLIALLIVPITADGDLPAVSSRVTAYVVALPPPPPPLVRPVGVRSTSTARARGPDAAFTMAPVGIRPEIPTDLPVVSDLPIGEIGAPGGGLGAILEGPALPPPPNLTGPIRVSQLVQPPRKIADARPIYPEIARIEGTVVIEASVDSAGRVDHLRVVRSVPLLDAAALDAVRQWRYTPSVLNGEPVAVLMTVTGAVHVVAMNVEARLKTCLHRHHATRAWRSCRERNRGRGRSPPRFSRRRRTAPHSVRCRACRGRTPCAASSRPAWPQRPPLRGRASRASCVARAVHHPNERVDPTAPCVSSTPEGCKRRSYGVLLRQ